jgi:hypothetical protein
VKNLIRLNTFVAELFDGFAVEAAGGFADTERGGKEQGAGAKDFMNRRERTIGGNFPEELDQSEGLCIGEESLEQTMSGDIRESTGGSCPGFESLEAGMKKQSDFFGELFDVAVLVLIDDVVLFEEFFNECDPDIREVYFCVVSSGGRAHLQAFDGGSINPDHGLPWRAGFAIHVVPHVEFVDCFIECDLQSDVFPWEQSEASFADSQQGTVDIPEDCAEAGEWSDGRSCGDGDWWRDFGPDQSAGFQCIGIFGE